MDPSGGYGPGDRTIMSTGRIAPPRGYALSGKIMLSTIVVLFAVVVLILFLHLYVRWHLLRLAPRRRRRPLIFATGFEAPARGLDPATLPVLIYEGGGKADAECAVCINEFEEGEKVRGLPRCGHQFHIECIDMWFHSHDTCPICRSAVEPPPPPSTAAVKMDGAVADAAPAADLCLYCGGEGGIGTSSSVLGVPELRVELRGSDEEAESPSWMKSPAGRIRAIRRFLSMDLSLYRGGGAAVEEAVDLEMGTAERVGDVSQAAAPGGGTSGAPTTSDVRGCSDVAESGSLLDVTWRCGVRRGQESRFSCF